MRRHHRNQGLTQPRGRLRAEVAHLRRSHRLIGSRTLATRRYDVNHDEPRPCRSLIAVQRAPPSMHPLYCCQHGASSYYKKFFTSLIYSVSISEADWSECTRVSARRCRRNPPTTPHSVDCRVRSIIAGDAIAGPAAIAGYCPTDDGWTLWSANRHRYSGVAANAPEERDRRRAARVRHAGELLLAHPLTEQWRVAFMHHADQATGEG